MQRFADKVVLVTGAASGMGAAMAKRFLSEGARVVLVDIHDIDTAELPPDRTLAIKADVSDSLAIGNAVEEAVASGIHRQRSCSSPGS